MPSHTPAERKKKKKPAAKTAFRKLLDALAPKEKKKTVVKKSRKNMGPKRKAPAKKKQK